jgi:hypothetical protein
MVVGKEAFVHGRLEQRRLCGELGTVGVLEEESHPLLLSEAGLWTW